jgi:hypothetical protein
MYLYSGEEESPDTILSPGTTSRRAQEVALAACSVTMVLKANPTESQMAQNMVCVNRLITMGNASLKVLHTIRGFWPVSIFCCAPALP